MLKTEKEEIAAVVVQFLQKTLAEERSLIVSEIVTEVVANMQQILESLIEQKLEQQKQTFQAEIASIKSQHYQQLEQLGQVVEQALALEIDNEQDTEPNSEKINEEISEQNLTSEISEERDLGDDLEHDLGDWRSLEADFSNSVDSSTDSWHEVNELISGFEFTEASTEIHDFRVNDPSTLDYADAPSFTESPEIIYNGEDSDPLAVLDNLEVVTQESNYEWTETVELVTATDFAQGLTADFEALDDQLEDFKEDFSDPVTNSADLPLPEIVEDSDGDLFSILDSGMDDLDRNDFAMSIPEQETFPIQSFDSTAISADTFDTDLFVSGSWNRPVINHDLPIATDDADATETDEFLAALTLIAESELAAPEVDSEPTLVQDSDMDLSSSDSSSDWDDSLFDQTLDLDEDFSSELPRTTTPEAQELESFIDEIDGNSIDEPLHTPLESQPLDLQIELQTDTVDPESLLTEFADLEAQNDFWAAVLQPNQEPSQNQAIAPPLAPKISTDHTWYLGIDFGYAGIRASLVDATAKIYPLLFEPKLTGDETIDQTGDQKAETLSTKVKVIFKTSDTETTEVEVPAFKNFLRLGLPYQTEELWQPSLQWTSKHKLTLKMLHTAAQELLVKVKTLTSHADLPVSKIMENLDMVILAYPSTWSDSYAINLREAVLAAGLVAQAEQVMVIEQAIAPLLTVMNTVINTDHQKSLPSKTLFIDSGAFSTSFLCANADQIATQAIDYAGLAINQDIILQLLYPQIKTRLALTDLPKVGLPSTSQRHIFQQFLLSSSVGGQLLAIAEEIKIFFSMLDQDQWQGELMGRTLKVSREQIDTKVIQPFIQTLNDELDHLLQSSGLQSEDIEQIFKLGGTIPLLGQWLEDRFANAHINQLSSSSLVNGLAIAPLSEWLDLSKQQYSDYFLLHEICALNLQGPISFNDLLKKLQNRGVNIKVCRDRLLQIVEGHLPKGILPWLEPEKSLILPDPNINRELLTDKLFEPISEYSYQPHTPKLHLLGAYLEMLGVHIRQNLGEPLVLLSKD